MKLNLDILRRAKINDGLSFHDPDGGACVKGAVFDALGYTGERPGPLNFANLCNLEFVKLKGAVVRNHGNFWHVLNELEARLIDCKLSPLQAKFLVNKAAAVFADQFDTVVNRGKTKTNRIA